MLFQYPAYQGGVGGALDNVFRALVDWGLVDAVLPFLLIFVLLYAILQKIAIFKDGEKPDKRINGLLSLVIAALVVVPHIAGLYPAGSDPIVMMSEFIPGAGVILLAVFCVIMLLGLAGHVPNLLLWVISLIALGILIFVIMMSVIPGFFPWFDFLRDPTIQALLIILLTLGLIVFFMFREPGGDFEDWAVNWIGTKRGP